MIQPEFLELAIERRAADAEPARDFRHVAVVARDRERMISDFHLFQLAHMAGAIGGRQRIGRGGQVGAPVAPHAWASAHRTKAARVFASTPMAAAICGKSQTSSSEPSHSTTARKIVFSSWRTLPGQENARAGRRLPASGPRPACALRRRSG
jgi:hypothetical protein